MSVFRIKRLHFNDGSDYEPGDLVVIVGPNNSGKTRALKDVVAHAATGKTRPIVIRSVECQLPDNPQKAYGIMTAVDHQGRAWFHAIRPDLNETNSLQVDERWEEQYRELSGKTPEKCWTWFRTHIAWQLVGFLDTASRLRATGRRNSPEADTRCDSLVHVLYRAGRTIEAQVAKCVKEAFDLEVCVDYSRLVRMGLRVGPSFSKMPTDPREAGEFLEKYEELDEQGDGIRSYVATAISLLALNRPIMLIDEPEAFLHSPQAYRIGSLIAESAGAGRQIIVATHSADVLRGIVQGRNEVDLLRVDRRGDINPIRRLSPDDVAQVVGDPLLSSARVLDGIFYRGAVVVEGDSDVRFYHALARKSRPNVDLHFVNADNKQTVPRIISTYRKLGVPCVGIVDIDALSDAREFETALTDVEVGSADLERALEIQSGIQREIHSVPLEKTLKDVQNRLAAAVEQIKSILEASGDSNTEARRKHDHLLASLRQLFGRLRADCSAWREIKQRGRRALSSRSQGGFEELSRICSSAGLFINPAGELESWLVAYAIPHTGQKRDWILRALKLIPELQVDPKKEVWSFTDAVVSHLARDSREGSTAPDVG